jgi:hypothetical protein
MKLHTREEIIRTLGLQTHRRSEFELLLILERLQSEDLVAEERVFALHELFSQYLEVRRIRAGLRPGRDWSYIRRFRLHQAEMLVHWISEEDTTADGLQEIRELVSKGDLDAFFRLVDELIEYEHKRPSMEQRRRASTPRKQDPFNELIYQELLRRWPQPLSEPEFMTILKRMAGKSIVKQVTSVEIELDDLDSDYRDEVPLGAVRQRMSRMRARLKKEKSLEPAPVN